jgi:hypothetical protein
MRTRDDISALGPKDHRPTASRELKCSSTWGDLEASEDLARQAQCRQAAQRLDLWAAMPSDAAHPECGTQRASWMASWQ